MQSVVQIQSALDFFTTVSKKRDDFFDFAEDYEPIKTFFSGEQSTIFARALDMLAIYDDSKTYIVNAELEDIVAQMRSITRQEKPYANIPKLPELRERFMSCYGEILQQEFAPVLDSIDQAWKRVLEVLSTKDYNDQKRTANYEKFQEIREGATRCNNVSTLRSFADKADALKRRLLDEMADLDYKREIQKAEEEARRIREMMSRKAGVLTAKKPVKEEKPKPEAKPAQKTEDGQSRQNAGEKKQQPRRSNATRPAAAPAAEKKGHGDKKGSRNNANRSNGAWDEENRSHRSIKTRGDSGDESTGWRTARGRRSQDRHRQNEPAPQPAENVVR